MSKETMPWWSALRRHLHCPLQENIPLAPLTTWHIGGRAQFFVRPTSENDLVSIMKIRQESPFPLWILGGGSNVLLLGENLPGLTVSMEKFLEHCIFSRKKNVFVAVSGGVRLPFLLGILVRYGLSGCEHLAGIPGTFGGALMGNAGIRERSIGDIVDWIETVEIDGSQRRWEGHQLKWGYRFCELSFENRFITAGAFRVVPSSSDRVREQIRTFMGRRRHQPAFRKTAGSVFKNPPGAFAGVLLEQCGCKGLTRGDARVSIEHANFIENMGTARSIDVLALIRECQRRVYEHHGVLLDLEIRMWGHESNETLEAV